MEPSDARADPSPRVRDRSRVLLVEDSLTDAAIAHGMLPEDRFEVEIATSLAEAMELLEWSLDFDVGMIDLKLPDARALDAPRRLLAHPNVPPLVVVSGSIDDLLVRESLRLGVDDVLDKAHVTTPQVLARVLSHAVDRAAFRTALEAQNRAILGGNTQLRKMVEQIAHDLRNPMVAMRGYAKALNRDEIDEEVRQRLRQELAAVAERSLMALDAMLIDIADTSGRTRINVTEMVAWAHDMLHEEFVESGASILLEDLPDVWGEPSSLRQVVLNILHNAIRHCTPGTQPRIRVRAELVAEGERIVFSDNGPGVPRAQLERIFGLGDRPPAMPGHAALGLASVRGAMTRHNGTAIARNNERGGLDIVLTFPRRRPGEVDAGDRGR